VTFRLAVLCLGLLTSCGAPARQLAAPRPTGEQITVVEFDTAGALVHYDRADRDLGHRLAGEIADELVRRGLDAEAVSAGTPLRGTIVVRGRVLDIDGGSRALRLWIGFGAGAARFVAEGTVARADGTLVASFRDGRSSSGAAELGLAGDTVLMDKCVRSVAGDIAEMIDTGQYREEAR
jgi:hypothetical protein